MLLGKWLTGTGNIITMQLNDRNVFSLLTIGGTLCAACFSALFTDWSTLEINSDQWKSILYLGFVASGIGFFLWNKGATQSNPGTLAAFNNAVVPLAVICSFLSLERSKILKTEPF